MRARNRWIHVVKTLVQIVDDVLRIDADEWAQLLGSLEETERKAEARSAVRRANARKDDTKAPPA
jgi:hypothetical protein